MIRYLIVLYLGIISIVLIDRNPLWVLPLVIVLVGQLWEKKWISLLGILTYCLVTAGKLTDGSFTDMLNLVLLTFAVIVPMIVLLEITLSSRPYKLQRISLIPSIISISIIAAFSGALIIIANAFPRIWAYISSDTVLQVFILMAMAIFFTGPILLGSRPPEKGKEARV